MLNKAHNNGDERLMTKFKIGDEVVSTDPYWDKVPISDRPGKGDIVGSVEPDYWKVSWHDRYGICTEHESKLALAKQETPATEFKAGDVVRVGPTHRNVFGTELNYPELVNKIFTVESVGNDYNGFQTVTLENSSYWVRSDDIELVSRKEDHPTVELTSEMIDWEDALFGEHETENIAAVYNITRFSEELVSLKIKKGFVWTSEDLIELGSHLFALAEYLETGTVDLSDDCIECENEHLRDSNERLVSANEAKRQRLAKIRELTEA
jgi:hypothetical protein